MDRREKLLNTLKRGEIGTVAKRKGWSLVKDFDGFNYYWAVRKGRMEYTPKQPWSFNSAVFLFKKKVR